MAKRILVVEDEAAIADSVAYSLKREGFDTRIAADGEAALRLTAEFKPDLILLDLMLPNLSGLEVCRILRARSTVPIKIGRASCRERV